MNSFLNKIQYNYPSDTCICFYNNILNFKYAVVLPMGLYLINYKDDIYILVDEQFEMACSNENNLALLVNINSLQKFVLDAKCIPYKKSTIKDYFKHYPYKSVVLFTNTNDNVDLLKILNKLLEFNIFSIS